MHSQEISRRTLLAQTGAVLSGLALTGSGEALGAATSASSGSAAQGSAATPAAASGTITLGRDMKVNRLGFGAMRITGPGIWGEPQDPVEARAVLRRTVELGVTFIDTADSYGPAVSEQLIAETLHPYPPGLVIATKGGIVRPTRERWDRDCRPEHLREACEASLSRLKLERIDLYQLHAVDELVPFEDSVGELARLQKAGKIRHVGVSNVNAAQLEQARRIVDVVSVQNRYNVSDRSSDGVLAACERAGIAFIPWSPLSQSPNEAASPRRKVLEDVARRRSISMPQAALAWLLARSPVMLPIPGTSQRRHLEENVAAAAVHLTADEMREIA
jgi:aryl-alcohol dehydrogenase-like predicted oxidoreductase